jgi:hypothetical protein
MEACQICRNAPRSAAEGIHENAVETSAPIRGRQGAEKAPIADGAGANIR